MRRITHLQGSAHFTIPLSARMKKSFIDKLITMPFVPSERAFKLNEDKTEKKRGI